MATPLPVSFRAAPLPSDFRGTPQAFMDAIVARLSLETQEQLTLFLTGSTTPMSDGGPWLKDNVEWYVWNAISGSYVPQTISWKQDLNPKPFRGVSAAAQDIVFSGPTIASQNLVLTEDAPGFDPYDVFTSSTFTAPEDGFYHFDAKCGVAGTAGAPTDNIITFYLNKNGAQLPNDTVFEPIGDVLEGRTLSISTNLQLSAGDTVTATVSIEVGGGSGTWTITKNDTFLSGYKICNLTTFD